MLITLRIFIRINNLLVLGNRLRSPQSLGQLPKYHVQKEIRRTVDEGGRGRTGVGLTCPGTRLGLKQWNGSAQSSLKVRFLVCKERGHKTLQDRNSSCPLFSFGSLLCTMGHQTLFGSHKSLLGNSVLECMYIIHLSELPYSCLDRYICYFCKLVQLF